MKFFIHTGDPGEIADAQALGVIDGVILDRGPVSGENALERRLGDICRVIDGPVIVEVTSEEAEAIIGEGRWVSGMLASAVIAVPVTIEGLKAARAMSDDGLRVCAGPIRTLTHALMAAKSGAAFVTAPWGAIALDAVTALDTRGLLCEVIATGIRRPDEVEDAVKAGAHAVSVPPRVIRKLFDANREQ